MAENKPIFDNPPQRYAARFKTSVLIYGGLALVFAILPRTLLFSGALVLVALIELVSYELSYNTFEGWLMDDDEITLSKWVMSGLKAKSFKLSAIKSIYYFKGARASQPQLIFQLQDEKFRCNVYKGIFDLAGTLKYFQTKGIKVSLISKDDEVQLYLDGKIASVPMENE